MESLFDEVKRLRFEEGLDVPRIVDRMGGRAKYWTVKSYVGRAIAEAAAKGVEIPPVSSAPRTQKAISRLHHNVGTRLLQHRLITLAAREGKAPTPTEFSQRYQLGNRETLPLMERGCYNFTLSDLVRIAEVLETTVADLVSVSTAQGGG